MSSNPHLYSPSLEQRERSSFIITALSAALTRTPADPQPKTSCEGVAHSRSPSSQRSHVRCGCELVCQLFSSCDTVVWWNVCLTRMHLYTHRGEWMKWNQCTPKQQVWRSEGNWLYETVTWCLISMFVNNKLVYMPVEWMSIVGWPDHVPCQAFQCACM